MDNLAPIILFLYNRPEHTLRCLESLMNNELASESTLYIFCDGAKPNATESDIIKINKVREIASLKQWCNKVIIKNQNQNIGLRSSVIAGVNEVFLNHNKAIIIEDDLLLSNYFLEYMNKGLHQFENDKSVSQISGHSFQLDIGSLKEDAYFLPLTTTWGWATWKRVWDEVDFSGTDYQKILHDKKTIKAFNLDNSYDYYSMLLDQLNPSKKISSWGIMFWLHTFKNNYKVLFPKYTLVSNIGFDGSGTHKENKSEKDDFKETNRVEIFPTESTVNHQIFSLIKSNLKKSNYSLKHIVLKKYNQIFKNF